MQYERRRYIDVENSSRLGFDTDITCPLVNDRVLATNAAPVTLPLGVLEVKSRSRYMPHVLRPMADDLRKDAFSKYARCCEALVQPLGRRV